MRRYFFAICLSFSFLTRLCQGGWTEPVYIDSHSFSPPPYNAIEVRHDSIFVIYDFLNFVRSIDGGDSWQDNFTLPDETGGFSDIGFKLTNDTLAAFYYSWQGIELLFSTDFGVSWQEPRIPGWEPSIGVPMSANYNSNRVSICMVDDIDYDNVHIFLKSSTDFGVTWMIADSIMSYHRPLEPFIYFFYDEPYILSTAFVGLSTSTIKLLFSVDDGEEWIFYDSLTADEANWEQRMDASPNGHMAFTYQEWFPQNDSMSQVYVCLSSDSGLTWSPPINLSFNEYNQYPSVAVSGDTVVAAWHGNLYPDSYDIGILVKRSYDFGETWEPSEIVAEHYSAYPEIKLESGKIHLIYTAGYDGLYYRRWEPETGVEKEIRQPSQFSLSQNHPNPFNAATTISYALPEPGEVVISIFNLLGQRVATIYEGSREAGEHKVVWDAAAFPSGIYFARLAVQPVWEAGERTENIKMVLLK